MCVFSLFQILSCLCWFVLITLLNVSLIIFFFNVSATIEIYTLSLHDALPISDLRSRRGWPAHPAPHGRPDQRARAGSRSEEHTSELQSHSDLVCRLLLEKKK